MVGKQDPVGLPLRFDPKLGRCANDLVDPDIFFPQGTREVVARQTAQAKSLCSQCEMVEACLMTALDNSEWGIWGGSTQQERKAIKRSRKMINVHLQLLMEGKYRVSGEDENTILFY